MLDHDMLKLGAFPPIRTCSSAWGVGTVEAIPSHGAFTPVHVALYVGHGKTLK